VESRPCSEPALDSRMLVGSRSCLPPMDVQLGRHILVNLSQEIQIFLMPMALSALRNYRPLAVSSAANNVVVPCRRSRALPLRLAQPMGSIGWVRSSA